MLDIAKKNKAVLGLFKDESAGKIIKELCFIRAKMYSYIKDGESDDKIRVMKYGRYEGVAAKGIQKSAVKLLTHEKYRNCILSKVLADRLVDSTFYRIASKEHQLMTIQQTKRGLSHYDDKRYYLDANRSHAHGHYRNVVGDRHMPELKPTRVI